MRIIAKNLVKIYGDRSFVNDVSFDVNKGEVVGLLGPNGAGKTTTFYMVVGLVRANSGTVFIEDDNKNGFSIGIPHISDFRLALLISILWIFFSL